MIYEALVATYETIQERRRRGLGPAGPLDVRLPLDRIQRVYAQHAWTSDDPLKNLEPNERLAILTMAPTWTERLRMVALRHEPHRQRLAMVEILCERRLQYDLAVSVALQTASPPAQLPPKPMNLSPYYQQRLKLHEATVSTMLSARSTESQRLLERSAEAKTYKERLDTLRIRIASLQSNLKEARQQERLLKKEPIEDEDEPEPHV